MATASIVAVAMKSVSCVTCCVIELPQRKEVALAPSEAAAAVLLPGLKLRDISLFGVASQICFCSCTNTHTDSTPVMYANVLARSALRSRVAAKQLMRSDLYHFENSNGQVEH